jgi:hypothetical protein
MFGLSKKKESGPFMEHPTGDFDSAVAAMEDAVTRLRKLPRWEQWITFSAQSEGGGPESYEFVEVRMLGDRLDVGEKPLDLARMVQAAGTSQSSLVADGTHYSVGAAAPREVAQILDAISEIILAFVRSRTRMTTMQWEQSGRVCCLNVRF